MIRLDERIIYLAAKKMKLRLSILIVSVILWFPVSGQNKLLDKLLSQNKSLFEVVLKDPGKFSIQIQYTQIDRDKNNFPHFKTHTYQLNPSQYFYPASTVKMPAAIAALEKLNNLNVVGLDKYSTMITGAGQAPQTSAKRDTTSATGFPSVAHYIKKVFLVSDNDAHNRLYEFIGQKALNELLWSKGFADVRLIHRLSVSGFNSEDNCYTNPVWFYNGDSLLYHQGLVYSKVAPGFALQGELRGKGYYDSGVLTEQPFDFSKKNYISLSNLNDVLKSVLFPESVPPDQRFNLTDEDCQFLYQCMSEFPRESKYPRYNDTPDNYVKFFMFGDKDKADRLPEQIRIFNKVGWAYGFLTDIAYVVDFEQNIEFMLAATIHVNEDGIFNDDKYRV